MSKACQSCGMPLKKDPQGGGRNTDGSKSLDYCSLCYEGGKFTQADFNAQDMQAFCIKKLTECNVPKFVAWLFTRRLPRLKRWSES